MLPVAARGSACLCLSHYHTGESIYKAHLPNSYLAPPNSCCFEGRDDDRRRFYSNPDWALAGVPGYAGGRDDERRGFAPTLT